MNIGKSKRGRIFARVAIASMVVAIGGVGASSASAAGVATKTTVVCTPTNPGVGTLVTCTGTVSSAGLAVSVDGFVDFYLNNVYMAECKLPAGVSATKSCSVLIPVTKLGPNQVTADFFSSNTGIAMNSPRSAPFTLNVGPFTPPPPGVSPTKTAVSCPTTATVGSPVTCVITVTDTGAPPTGTVLLATNPIGGGTFSKCTLVASGPNSSHCLVTFTPKTTGRATVFATFVGNARFGPSSSSTSTITSRPGPPPPPAAPCDDHVADALELAAAPPFSSQRRAIRADILADVGCTGSETD